MINAAITALEARDPDAGLMHLISLWRETRSSALAEVIDQLSKQAPGSEFERTRRTLFRRDLADDRDRLRWLEPFQTDPRIARVLIDLLADPPRRLRRPRARPFWSAVVDTLIRIRDPRSAHALDGSTDPWLRPLRDELTSNATAWSEAPVDVGPLARFIVTPRAELNAQATLDAVYANPLDLDLRRICSDALTEAGDPRGEFMSLQLAGDISPAGRRRQRQLARAHGRKWLGVLDPVVPLGGVHFENGFLSRVTLAGRAVQDEGALEPFVGLDLWSTVERLTIVRHRGDHLALLEHPVMRSVRWLRDESPALLAGTRPLAIEKLVAGWNQFEPGFFQFFKGETMPALRRLQLGHFSVGMFESLWISPLMKRLESIAIEWPNHDDLPRWLEVLPRVPANVKTIQLGQPLSSECDARLVRVGSSWRCVLGRARYAPSRIRLETYDDLCVRLVKAYPGVHFDFSDRPLQSSP